MDDKIHPFQHLFKKVWLVWKKKCQESFQQIKDYLLTPPVLMPPVCWRHLILYILGTTSTLGELLPQNDDDGHEKVVYYINHTLVCFVLNYRPTK